jgi:hypothetical protein
LVSVMQLPVLTLPAEVRQIIWKSLLISQASICMKQEPEFYSLNLTRRKARTNCSPTSQILRANQTIYSETRPILYGSNIYFISTDDKDIEEFRTLIGQHNFSLIKRVAISYRRLIQSPNLQDRLVLWQGLCSLELIWAFKDGKYSGSPMRSSGDRIFLRDLVLRLPENSSRSETVEAVKQFSESELPLMKDPNLVLPPFAMPFPSWSTIFPGVAIKITLRWLVDHNRDVRRCAPRITLQRVSSSSITTFGRH